jgi:membrane associated rhomboid family serine protease
MGIGRDLGLQLRAWIHNGLDLSASPALANRLIDALGAQSSSLRGPVRDLAAQPLTLRTLRLKGAEQQAALQALHQLLAETYSPQVLAELLDLLDAATGLTESRPPGSSATTTAPPAAVHPAGRPSPLPSAGLAARARGALDVGWRRLLRRRPAWEAELQAIAPGLLAGLCGGLVLAWGAHELDRWTFARLGWSSGMALAATLVNLQLITLIPPLQPLWRHSLIDRPGSGDPHRLWCWIRAPWQHQRTAEALVNGLFLLILLGPTPLGAGKVVLRYVLTTLACLAGAVLVARRFGVNRRWGGASGAIAALTSLAAVMSLLQGQALTFQIGALTIPAWVLLVVNGGLQLSWQLPRQGSEDHSQPLQRLWSSTWWWGTLAGTGWALFTRFGQLLRPLFQAAGQG